MLERSPDEVDPYPPAGIVQRIDADAVRVLPFGVALPGIPAAEPIDYRVGHADAGWMDRGGDRRTGAEGFEPSVTGPKPVALPLGHAPLRGAVCPSACRVTYTAGPGWARPVEPMNESTTAAPARPLACIVMAGGKGTRMRSALPEGPARALREADPRLGARGGARGGRRAARRGHAAGRRGRARAASATTPRRSSSRRRSARATPSAAGSPRSTASHGDVLVVSGDTPLIRGELLHDVVAVAPRRAGASRRCSRCTCRRRTPTDASCATRTTASSPSSRRATRRPRSSS